MAALDLDKQAASREKLLKEQFAGARRRVAGQQRETQRQSGRGLDRLAARTGQTGGAIQKARQQATRDIGRQFGDVEAQVAGAEAGALEQLRGEVTGQKLAVSEAEKTRQQQRDQFKQTLDFQKNSFAQQMQFQWSEFTENQRTNVINALTALDEAGIKNRKKMREMMNVLRGVPRQRPAPVEQPRFVRRG